MSRPSIPKPPPGYRLLREGEFIPATGSMRLWACGTGPWVNWLDHDLYRGTSTWSASRIAPMAILVTDPLEHDEGGVV